jgi:hypothetical protein
LDGDGRDLEVLAYLPQRVVAVVVASQGMAIDR